MKTTTEIITDKELDPLFKDRDFGNRTNRTVVLETLLKRACNNMIGKTSQGICTDLGLLDEKSNLTHKGSDYLMSAFVEIEMKRKGMKEFLTNQVYSQVEALSLIMSLNTAGKSLSNEDVVDIFTKMINEFKAQIKKS